MILPHWDIRSQDFLLSIFYVAKMMIFHKKDLAKFEINYI